MELKLPVQENLSPSLVVFSLKANPSPQHAMLLQTAVGGSSRMAFILPVNIERLGERGLLNFCFSFSSNAAQVQVMKSTGRIRSFHRLHTVFLTNIRGSVFRKQG